MYVCIHVHVHESVEVWLLCVCMCSRYVMLRSDSLGSVQVNKNILYEKVGGI